MYYTENRPVILVGMKCVRFTKAQTCSEISGVLFIIFENN